MGNGVCSKSVALFVFLKKLLTALGLCGSMQGSLTEVWAQQLQCGLSCPMACAVLIPWPGDGTQCPHEEVDSQLLTTKEVPFISYLNSFLIHKDESKYKPSLQRMLCIDLNISIRNGFIVKQKFSVLLFLRSYICCT